MFVLRGGSIVFFGFPTSLPLVKVAAVGEEDWLRHFTSDIKPSFGLMAYIDYLVKQTKCTTSELIVALIYLDRLTATHHPRIILSTYTIHRLFLTSLLLSCKFLDDRARGNNFFARIVNCSCEELNTLETIMLTKLGFKLFVSTNTYASYAEQVFPTL